jgi:hypothetical protein
VLFGAMPKDSIWVYVERMAWSFLSLAWFFMIAFQSLLGSVLMLVCLGIREGLRGLKQREMSIINNRAEVVYFWRLKEEGNGYRVLNGSLLTVKYSCVISRCMTSRSN